jgi:hypothetical protein
MTTVSTADQAGGVSTHEVRLPSGHVVPRLGLCPSPAHLSHPALQGFDYDYTARREKELVLSAGQEFARDVATPAGVQRLEDLARRLARRLDEIDAWRQRLDCLRYAMNEVSRALARSPLALTQRLYEVSGGLGRLDAKVGNIVRARGLGAEEKRDVLFDLFEAEWVRANAEWHESSVRLDTLRAVLQASDYGRRDVEVFERQGLACIHGVESSTLLPPRTELEATSAQRRAQFFEVYDVLLRLNQDPGRWEGAWSGWERLTDVYYTVAVEEGVKATEARGRRIRQLAQTFKANRERWGLPTKYDPDVEGRTLGQRLVERVLDFGGGYRAE